MGVGHAAVALGVSGSVPRTNAGWLIFAAFLADFLLGVFAAFGLEHAQVPADYASRHYLLFTFPYSHGLVPLLVWGAILGGLVCVLAREKQRRVFFVVGALVVSHYLLDGLVHVAGLPVAGENSPKLGLGLWKNMPLELVLETLLTLVCVLVYLRFIGGSAPRLARFGMPIFMALLAALTWTTLFATTAPTLSELIPSWIVLPVILAAIPYALDRKRARQAQVGFQ